MISCYPIRCYERDDNLGDCGMFKTFVDLFCGIGGFRLGLERCGLKCVWSCDINPTARKVYNDNYGEMPAGDIRQVNAQDIPSMDIICGGFPCQSFSKAGKQEGFDCENGALIYEVSRIAEHHKPKALILENVPNLKNIDGGQGLVRVCCLFEKIGYNCQWFELNGSEYGVAQRRVRVYFLFIRNDIYKRITINYQYLREAMWDLVTIGDILDPVSELTADCEVNQDLFELRLSAVGKHRSYNMLYCGSKIYQNDGVNKVRWHQSCGMRVYSDNGIGPTLTSRIYFVYDSRIKRIRKLTPKELLKLQGFPQDFIIPKGSAVRLVGNSVIPRMAELVYRLMDVEKPI